MRAISIIFKRELKAYLRSPFTWVIAALFLLIDGILFQAFGFGGQKSPLSAYVLEQFFIYGGLSLAIAAVALSFRLVSEERQNHSMVLLNTSPIRDVDIIVGKFLAALVFLVFLVALSFYIPLMLKVGNKITYTQILVGYVGMVLFGAAMLAIGIFASSLTRYQLVAVVIAAVIAAVMSLLWKFSTRLEGTPREVLGDLDLWWMHYQFSFARGILNLKDVVYYLATTYFFLLLSVKTLEAKRWQ
ncbi:MAG TPA: ABC transporter permease [Kofleriaceae bacterium]|nr:ABC transporter permease [Kofleriaceae bacterium]